MTTKAQREAAAKAAERAASAPKPTAPSAQLGAIGDEPMVENGQSVHQGLHDNVEAELHFGGEIHDGEEFERNWEPPKALEAPPPRVGFTQRWIRISLLGKSDAKNQSAQGQQGWRPRSLATVPGEQRGRYPTIRDTRTGGEFMVSGDLILCEMSDTNFAQMCAYYQKVRHNRVNALSADMQRAAIPNSEEHGFGAPEILTRKTSVTTRKPIVQAD